jgi:hypothetical protein
MIFFGEETFGRYSGFVYPDPVLSGSPGLARFWKRVLRRKFELKRPT